MKLNRSLGISNKIHAIKTGNILGLLEEVFPSSILEEFAPTSAMRKRVFTPENTLLTMVLTATQQDKSLKNSVDLYYTIHQQHKREVAQAQHELMEQTKQLDMEKGKRAGRPKKYSVRLPSSLEKDISLNTAAYSKARERVPLKMTEQLFKASGMGEVENVYTHWHGYRVFIGDGTYIQMQDTPEIRKDYAVKHKGEDSPGYPQGLLEVITERGTGQLYSFKLANRHTSELALFYEMLDELPPNSLVLLDDLYNCYEIISKCKRKGIELVVPAKRERNYEVVEVLGQGDEIIRIKPPKNRSKWLKDNEKPNCLLLRRIQCQSPDGTTYTLHTTLLDKRLDKYEIQELYLTRWDIEISIREIKTIMDINILRSKTPEMARKELIVSLATYNLIRKIIYASIKDLPFSPKEDFIYQYYTLTKNILIDKKGRVYNRWSTGRSRTTTTYSQTDVTKTKTEPKI